MDPGSVRFWCFVLHRYTPDVLRTHTSLIHTHYWRVFIYCTHTWMLDGWRTTHFTPPPLHRIPLFIITDGSSLSVDFTPRAPRICAHAPYHAAATTPCTPHHTRGMISVHLFWLDCIAYTPRLPFRTYTLRAALSGALSPHLSAPTYQPDDSTCWY